MRVVIGVSRVLLDGLLKKKKRLLVVYRLAYSQNLYFLLKLRRASVTKIKTAGVDRQCKLSRGGERRK